MNAVLKPAPMMPIAAARDAIGHLSAAMLALPTELHEPLENRHDFVPGIYARTIFARGRVYVSRIHKTQHFFVAAEGACTVVDSHGERHLIVAPYLGKTEPGTQRAIHVHADTVWTTFHATDLTDPDEIGRQIMAESFDEAAPADPVVTP